MISSSPTRNVLTRRGLLETATATGAATLAGPLGAVRAQPASKTLVIAAPATPQGLNMEYDISLGSIDAMGGLYDGLLAYATMPDPDAPGVMREDIGVHPDKPHGLALQGRLAESWDVSADGRTATSSCARASGATGATRSQQPT